MSSPQSSSLPVGYSLRLATQEDALRVLYFERIGHGYFVDKVYTLLLILLLMLAMYTIFMLPLSSLSSVTPFILGFSTFIISVACPFILFSTYSFLYRQEYRDQIENRLFSIWLIERGNIICGYIWCLNYDNCTFISNVLISKVERNNGFRSSLVNFVTDTCRRPIYLSCNSRLKSFYYRNGFIDANYEDVPNEILRLHRYRNSDIMVFSEI